MNRYGTGEKGEVIAKNYLYDAGYKILEENLRYKGTGEIDLVAMEGADLVFVEVKTRVNYEFGEPLESVTLHKQRCIQRCAERYISERDISFQNVRFDVIIVFNDSVEHYKEAF
ncbi:MAG: YraN family protein [Christensenellales bacterium]